jgi:hypothetical protein
MHSRQQHVSRTNDASLTIHPQLHNQLTTRLINQNCKPQSNSQSLRAGIQQLESRVITLSAQLADKQAEVQQLKATVTRVHHCEQQVNISFQLLDNNYSRNTNKSNNSPNNSNSC